MIEGSSLIAKFLPLMVVAFPKIRNTRGADLEGSDDYFTFGSVEYVANVTAKRRCPTGS